MTLQLELSPAEEQELTTAAAREGVPVGVLAHRLFVSGLRQRRDFDALQGEAAAAFTASGESEEDVYAFGEALVKRMRGEMRTQEARP